jgi:hypothetical protein
MADRKDRLWRQELARVAYQLAACAVVAVVLYVCTLFPEPFASLAAALVVAIGVIAYQCVAHPLRPTLAALVAVLVGSFVFWFGLPGPSVWGGHWRGDLAWGTAGLLLFRMLVHYDTWPDGMPFKPIGQYLGGLAAVPVTIGIGALTVQRHAVAALTVVLVVAVIAATVVAWRVRISHVPLLAVGLLYMAITTAAQDVANADRERHGSPEHSQSNADVLATASQFVWLAPGIIYSRRVRDAQRSTDRDAPAALENDA